MTTTIDALAAITSQCYNYLQFSAIMDIRRRKAREVEQRKYGLARVLQKINLHGYDYIEINIPLGCSVFGGYL